MKQILFILIFNSLIINSSNISHDSHIYRTRFNPTPTPKERQMSQQNPPAHLGETELKTLVSTSVPINFENSEFLKFCQAREQRTQAHNDYLKMIQPEIEQHLQEYCISGDHSLQTTEEIDIWKSHKSAWTSFILVHEKIKFWTKSLPEKHEPLPKILFPRSHMQKCEADWEFISKYLEIRDASEENYQKMQ